MYTPNQKQAVLNRAAFTTRSFRSGGLGVLTTLFHRFAEAGEYDVYISEIGLAERHVRVQVLEAQGPFQYNLDLTTLGGDPGCCEDEDNYQLHAGGVMGFYASEGTSVYGIVVKHNGPKEKRVLLDSQKLIPAGDLFAVTLVQPGVYAVTDALNKTEMLVEVQMPQPRASLPGTARSGPRKPPSEPGESGYSPRQAQVIGVRKDGFSARRAQLSSGQTVLFACEVDTHLIVDLQKAAPSTEKPAEKARLRVTRTDRPGPRKA